MKYLKFLPFYILSLIPLRILFLISDFAFVLIYHLIKYRRDVVRENLKNAFPDKRRSEIIRTEKRFYKHFCDVSFEAIKCLTASKKTIKERFRVKNKDVVEDAYSRKKSIIMYTAHYGNWEWLSFLPLYVPHQTTTFYKKLSSNYFNHLMQVIRSRFGAICIESTQGYRTLIKLRKENKVTFNCIIGDQCPRRTSPKHWVNFLNQETAFLEGADRIAKKLDYIVIYPSIHKHKRGVYDLEFKVITSNPEQIKSSKIINLYAKKLEESITTSPELWLWSHKRWKLTKSNIK